MTSVPRLLTATGAVPDSPARVEPATRAPWRVGLVQHRWHPDPAEHRAALADGGPHGRRRGGASSSASRS